MTMYDKPKVTVLISTYNRPQYLAEAIESVVNQRYQNWELIILNDGGVDVEDVVAKFADPRIIYVPDNVNRGAARRFNQGLNMARGEYVTYLGDDDLFYPNHIEVLAKALDENPNIALAYSDLYGASSIADPETGKRFTLDKRVTVSRDFNREFMFHYNHILHVSIMHRLDAAKRVGGFDEKVKVLIEWSLNRRLAFIYDFMHVEEATGEYHMAVFKSDRISVRERRDGESYQHNLRKIKCNLPAEPWDKIDVIDLIYVVDEWGAKLNNHLKEIIDNFDHPFYIKLVNNGTGRTLNSIRASLGNLSELRNISIINLTSKQSLTDAARYAAKRSKAKYVLLATPSLQPSKDSKRLFASLDFLKLSAEGSSAIRWDIEGEGDTYFNCLATREYFLKCSRPGLDTRIHFQALNIGLPKGFKFDAMFAEFKKHRDKKEYSECRRILNEILADGKGAPHIQYMIHYLAPVCLAQKDYETLERELRSLIERGYRPDNLIRLGVMLGQQGRWVEAVDTLKEALAAHGLKEEDFDASCFPFSLDRNLSVFYLLTALGEACLEINDMGAAARYYHMASKIKTNSHIPFLGFAKVYFHAGQLDRAEVALQKLPGRGGQEDPETHRMLGRLCQKRKNLELAFQCYTRAFELAPGDEKNVDPFYFCGSSLGKWKEMYDHLSTFVQKNPEHAMGLARLAAVSFQLGDYSIAMDMAETSLKFDPQNPIAKSLVGRAQTRLIEKKNAESQLTPEVVADSGGLKLDFDISPISW